MVTVLAGNFWNLLLESAPWLLAGYLLAGIIRQLLPAAWIESQLARPGLGSIFKGAILGAPLPLCSCGVIPTALAIRQAGASKGATASFLVATPETGVDSIAYSYAILGPLFAWVRPLAALFSALVAGILVHVAGGHDEPVPGSSCCGGGCGSVKAHAQAPGWRQRLLSVFGFGFGQMVADTGKWLAIGLVAATLIATYVPESFFLRWGDGLPAMLLLVIIGLPMYICATASTPVAASLLFAGVSPGATLVFLLTGPATNLATMGVIRDQLGTRSMVAYLAGVILSAIAAGLQLDLLAASLGWTFAPRLGDHAETWPLWRHLAAIVLVSITAYAYLPRQLFQPREPMGQRRESSASHSG